MPVAGAPAACNAPSCANCLACGCTLHCRRAHFACTQRHKSASWAPHVQSQHTLLPWPVSDQRDAVSGMQGSEIRAPPQTHLLSASGSSLQLAQLCWPQRCIPAPCLFPGGLRSEVSDARPGRSFSSLVPVSGATSGERAACRKNHRCCNRAGVLCNVQHNAGQAACAPLRPVHAVNQLEDRAAVAARLLRARVTSPCKAWQACQQRPLLLSACLRQSTNL